MDIQQLVCHKACYATNKNGLLYKSWQRPLNDLQGAAATAVTMLKLQMVTPFHRIHSKIYSSQANLVISLANMPALMRRSQALMPAPHVA